MPRGGFRENAGRRTTWESGCQFQDTKVIRVPKSIADRVLEVAHKLDAGEIIDLDTKSINDLVDENDKLKSQCEKLHSQVLTLQQELKSIKSQSRQLDIFGFQLNDQDFDNACKQALGYLKIGIQSQSYKTAQKACHRLIKLLKEKIDLVSNSEEYDNCLFKNSNKKPLAK